MAPSPVSIVTVTRNGLFFTRLLIEKIREFTTDRPYEVLVVDRGSSDGTRRWVAQQPDARLLRFGQWRTRGHGHGQAAERAVRRARYDRILLIDFDAHPVSPDWLTGSIDRLDARHRLAGAVFVDPHQGNPHGWYIHPHFMAFFKADLGGLVVLRKRLGDTTDTGEESTVRVLAAGFDIIRHDMTLCARFAVGNPHVPTVAGGVFHAWYSSRLENNEAEVIQETNGAVTRANYLDPLMAKQRSEYRLDY